MSPDYDGTIEADFLCDPGKLLTQDIGAQLEQFLFEGGISDDLASILGIGKVLSAAEQFKLYLLGLMPGNMTNLETNSTAANTSSSITGPITISSTATKFSSTSTSSFLSIIPANILRKREVPFGTPQQQACEAQTFEAEINKRAFTGMFKRQGISGKPSALAQLIAGLAGPISEAPSSLIF